MRKMDKKEKGFVKEYSENRTRLIDVLPISVPYCISIETSNICNYKCVMCPQGSDNYEKLTGSLQNMKQDCFEEVVADIKKTGSLRMKR